MLVQDPQPVHVQPDQDLCGVSLELIQPDVSEAQEQRGKEHGPVAALSLRLGLKRDFPQGKREDQAGKLPIFLCFCLIDLL